MKKIILTTMAIATMLVALVGCGKCEHTFSEATCQTLATCTQCGETTGELAEHKWVEATCQAPKTCSVCGITEGDVAAHDFAPATLAAPKTCNLCGATEGNPLTLTVESRPYEHDDFYAGQTTWGLTMDDTLVGFLYDVDQEGQVVFEFSDVDNNLISDYYLPLETDVFTYSCLDHAPFYCMVSMVWDETYEPGFDIIICDPKGNLVFEEPFFNWDWNPEHLADLYWDNEFYLISTTQMTHPGYIEFYDGEEILRVVYDVNNRSLILADDYAPAAIPGEEEYYIEYYDTVNNIYMAEKNEKYSILDKDGNPMIEGLDDFSGFNVDGYALVSSDGRATYDLIDMNCVVVAQDVVPNCSNAYCRGGRYFINTIDEEYLIQDIRIE